LLQIADMKIDIPLESTAEEAMEKLKSQLETNLKKMHDKA
jgi:hypothetical protein